MWKGEGQTSRGMRQDEGRGEGINPGQYVKIIGEIS
jgi:hypothetical protein|tara:strand:- start:128 stop:235 length:108 start_codon:yes stop_codon:yes gene_type:complete